MTTTMDAEQSVILRSLAQVRHRLYAVRLTERCALALAYASTIALFFTAARVVFGRYPVSGIALAAVPLAAAIWLWIKSPRLAHSSGLLVRRAGISTQLLKTAAVLTAAIAAAVAVILLAGLLHGTPLWAFPAATGAVFLIAAALSVRPVQDKAAAIFVDQQVGLEERVSTALELLATKPASAIESAFRAPVIASAVNACHDIRTAKVGYARIDRRVYALAATAALAAVGISLLAPLAAQAGPMPRHYQPVAQKGVTLAEKLQELEAAHKIEDPALKQKLAELRKVAESMKQGTMSPFDANEKLASIAKSLKDANKDPNNSADLEKAMEQSKELQPLAKASEEVKTATANAGNNAPGAELKEESAQTKVQNAAKDLAGKLGSMSDKDKQDLAKELKSEADAATDPQTKSDLEQAAKAAQGGNADQLQQKLADAGNRMGQQGAQQQLSSEQVREAMDQIERAQGGGLSAGEQQSKPGGGEQQEGSGQDGSQQEANGGQQGSQSGQQGANGQQGNSGQQQGQQGGQGSAGGQQANSGKNGGQDAGGDGQTRGGGSTNFHAPSGPGDSKTGGPIGGTQTFVKVYGEKPIQSRGAIENTPGHINPLGTPSGSIDTLAQGDKGAATIQTYESELPAARKRALDDLSTQPIPPQDKDLIRAYYAK